ncbi:MAG: glycosyltransferase family 92 protein, partial [Burkholderiaceae bacterium]|nr:glycosyltransferase family 92 protein [Burkholderiaceae bacterium]
MTDKKKTALWRRIARGLVWSKGLRDAIAQGRIGEYYAHKRYLASPRFRQDDAGPFPHFLAVVAIVKDEGLYLAEWIEYHKLVGVDVFFVYDNDSTDNTPEVLAPYIARGDVVYTPWSGMRQQHRVYNAALQRFRMETRWLAFIDLDEFIVPLKKQCIPDVLADFSDQVGLSAHWLMYGDSGHKSFSDGLVIERFTAHALQADEWVKTIINPRAAFSMETHHACFVGNHAAVNENRRKVRSRSRPPVAETIRVNHYWGKSWEEYQMKRVKGRVGSRTDILPEDDSFFLIRNRNEAR